MWNTDTINNKNRFITTSVFKKISRPTGGFSLDPTQVGVSSSLTADICLGVTGTYDLNNQKIFRFVEFMGIWKCWR